MIGVLFRVAYLGRSLVLRAVIANIGGEEKPQRPDRPIARVIGPK